MLIASRNYTIAQRDTGAAEENQQQAKQLHEEQPREKIPTLATQNTTPSSASPPNPNRPPTSRILAVTCLASHSSFPMHRYKFKSRNP